MAVAAGIRGHGRRIAAALWLVLVLVVAAASVASARFVVEKNSVNVVSPRSLRGRHQAAIANYGVPEYGGTLTGVVMYPEESKLANGCKPFGGATPFRSRSGRPVVLLVDRGGCYFALKTWNAQAAGAAAVLVANSVDEPLLTMDAPEEETPDMAFLANITVPSWANSSSTTGSTGAISPPVGVLAGGDVGLLVAPAAAIVVQALVSLHVCMNQRPNC